MPNSPQQDNTVVVATETQQTYNSLRGYTKEVRAISLWTLIKGVLLPFTLIGLILGSDKSLNQVEDKQQ